MSKFQNDEYVYLRCRVSHAPEGDQRLYRVTTVSDNVTVWAEEDELTPAETYPEASKEKNAEV